MMNAICHPEFNVVMIYYGRRMSNFYSTVVCVLPLIPLVLAFACLEVQMWPVSCVSPFHANVVSCMVGLLSDWTLQLC